MGRPRILGTIIGSHIVVDYYSFIIVSLLPLLAARLSLDNAEKAMVLGMGSITSGFIQPVVAWIGDRLNTRVIATIGLGVAAAACSVVGLATGFWSLMMIAGIGALGVGAFHPPAAAVTGQVSGSRRSLGVSLFFLAGMIGGMAGNVASPQFVRLAGRLAGGEGDGVIALGLQWMCVLIVPGLLVALLLAKAIHDAPHRHDGAHDQHRSLSPEVRRLRWRAVWLLYASNVTRFTTNMALVYLFVRWIETRAAEHAGVEQIAGEVAIRASALNGTFQAAMQLGMGAAGLAAGWLLRTHHEKASLVAVPLLGAACIGAMAGVDSLGLGHDAMLGVGLLLAVLAGMGFGGTVPTVIALAQRLLPHRTALASGMMMGGAWGLAFVGPMLAERIEAWAGLSVAFIATAGLLVVCAGLGAMLPGRVVREV
ncbi:MAG: MFS transporter [Phycisphaerales bacterium]|nr:MFS transporter [Phycisphaerales bacterium]